MNLFLLCILSLVPMGVHELSNPSSPRAGEPSGAEQVRRDNEEAGRNMSQAPEELIRTSALPAPVDSDSPPVQKESESTEPHNRSPENDNFLRLQDWIVAAFTLGLLIVAIFQYKLNRRVFYSTHRPRLRIRNVIVEELDRIYNGKMSLSEIDELPRYHRGYFKVANIGNTEATMIGHFMIFLMTNNLPMNIPVHWDTDSDSKLASGEFRYFHLPNRTEWSVRDIHRLWKRDDSSP